MGRLAAVSRLPIEARILGPGGVKSHPLPVWRPDRHLIIVTSKGSPVERVVCEVVNLDVSQGPHPGGKGIHCHAFTVRGERSDRVRAGRRGDGLLIALTVQPDQISILIFGAARTINE